MLLDPEGFCCNDSEKQGIQILFMWEALAISPIYSRLCMFSSTALTPALYPSSLPLWFLHFQATAIFKEAGVNNLTIQVEKETYFQHISGLGVSTNQLYEITKDFKSLSYENTANFINAIWCQLSFPGLWFSVHVEHVSYSVWMALRDRIVIYILPAQSSCLVVISSVVLSGYSVNLAGDSSAVSGAVSWWLILTQCQLRWALWWESLVPSCWSQLCCFIEGLVQNAYSCHKIENYVPPTAFLDSCCLHSWHHLR